MKVSELISKLQQVNPDCTVETVSSQYNGNEDQVNEDTLIVLADSGSNTIALIPSAYKSYYEIPPNTHQRFMYMYSQWIEL